MVYSKELVVHQHKYGLSNNLYFTCVEKGQVTDSLKKEGLNEDHARQIVSEIAHKYPDVRIRNIVLDDEGRIRHWQIKTGQAFISEDDNEAEAV